MNGGPVELDPHVAVALICVIFALLAELVLFLILLTEEEERRKKGRKK